MRRQDPAVVPWTGLELGHQEEGTIRQDKTQRGLTSQPRVSELAIGGWSLALEAKGFEKEDLVLMRGRSYAGETRSRDIKPIRMTGRVWSCLPE